MPGDDGNLGLGLKYGNEFLGKKIGE